ncbi:MAG: ThuA domain-containing protein [Rubripirellula sp.]|nr:ThuA domain-containing protein [Rubripirellula sp.]
MRLIKKPLLVFLCVIARLSFADQPSSPTLPNLDGLILRLDAGQAATQQEPGPIKTWHNLANTEFQFSQASLKYQPKLVAVSDSHVVRFADSHLRSIGNQITTKSLTLFAVVSAHSNEGDYRGWLSSNAPERRDYQSGFNLDLGPAPSQKVDAINVEGIGFGGYQNLLKGQFEFGSLHQITMRVNAATEAVSLRVDGKQTGRRPYNPSAISLQEMTLGARFLTQGPGPQQVHGESKCDLAEILIYDRFLSKTEMEAVENYLEVKHIKLAEALPHSLPSREDSIELVKAENPPAIQMLVPGFEIRELPIQLTNVNNVRFREDGTLVTLGYNGDIHLLSDSDGDGLEDQVKQFWKNNGSLRGPIGMIVTPKNYPHGEGIFTSSKGKVSLIVDTDDDNQADEEIVVATGWEEIPQNVDATGIAMDSDGALYFGLGTANYANAYLVDDEGVAQYNLDSDRGTVQRVSPDFKTRETICTGIRFPIAFAFNQHGDLFCAEQEGATWLPNGNPFDELLQIIPNRHYGFPPRHPRHNPTVIDEPSVFDYSPQHQSTCGMIFNGDGESSATFGPAWWSGNAIVCGESRGKIWRTQLLKTEAGYVASNQLIACLQMLTIDACVAPNGDLVVACHSGPPDWGTGPTGIGKLYRIRMSEPTTARPRNIWANSSQEIQIAFDSPLDPTMLQGVTDRIVIQHGEFVRAGDAFENLVPPYSVVQRQLATPRKSLAVRGVALSADRRSLLLQTDPMRTTSHYSITIPLETNHDQASGNPVSGKTGSGKTGSSKTVSSRGSTGNSIPQISLMEVDLTLNGVEASFTGEPDRQTNQADWKGWLPHFNWQVSDEFTRMSAEHDKLRLLLANGGELTLTSRLDLKDILRPTVQPGSTLDYEWPAETVTLIATSSQSFSLETTEYRVQAQRVKSGMYEASFETSPASASSVPLTMRLAIAAGEPADWTLTAATNEDARRRALPLRRFRLPWTSDEETGITESPKIAEIAGGNWGKGRRVFHSEAASCFKCHAINGGGPNIGPDLANLVHRDYASVLRDIQNPSFAINPDYLGNSILLADGRVLTGTLQTVDGKLYLGEATGKRTELKDSEIVTIKPADISVMPKGIEEKLTPQQMRDLMTFLLTLPPHMPLDSPLEAPPIRTQAEISTVLSGSKPLPTKLDEITIVLVAGKKDHGPGEHDYPAWQTQWGQLLAAADAVNVDAAWGFPNDDQLSQADVLVFFQKGDWNDDRQTKMDQYFDRGGGAVYIHWAVNGNDRVDDFSKRIGLASKGGSIGYRHGTLALNVHNTDHPIMRNIEPLQLYDESYWRLTGDPQNVTLFASSVEEGAARPQIWSYDRSAGRVFVSIPGHYNWTFDDPIFRTILLRGLAWTAAQPIDRFNELVRLGARTSK